MSDNRKHTPGPWLAAGHTVYANVPNPEAYLWDAPETVVVGASFHRGDEEFDGMDDRCELGAADSDGEASANARLIAAAPDMLAALDRLLNGNGTASTQAEWHAEREEASRLARAAIAKAQGGEG